MGMICFKQAKVNIVNRDETILTVEQKKLNIKGKNNIIGEHFEKEN